MLPSSGLMLESRGADAQLHTLPSQYPTLTLSPEDTHNVYTPSDTTNIYTPSHTYNIFTHSIDSKSDQNAYADNSYIYNTLYIDSPFPVDQGDPQQEVQVGETYNSYSSYVDDSVYTIRTAADIYVDNDVGVVDAPQGDIPRGIVAPDSSRRLSSVYIDNTDLSTNADIAESAAVLLPVERSLTSLLSDLWLGRSKKACNVLKSHLKRGLSMTQSDMGKTRDGYVDTPQELLQYVLQYSSGLLNPTAKVELSSNSCMQQIVQILVEDDLGSIEAYVATRSGESSDVLATAFKHHLLERIGMVYDLEFPYNGRADATSAMLREDEDGDESGAWDDLELMNVLPAPDTLGVDEDASNDLSSAIFCVSALVTFTVGISSEDFLVSCCKVRRQTKPWTPKKNWWMLMEWAGYRSPQRPVLPSPKFGDEDPPKMYTWSTDFESSSSISEEELPVITARGDVVHTSPLRPDWETCTSYSMEIKTRGSLDPSSFYASNSSTRRNSPRARVNPKPFAPEVSNIDIIRSRVKENLNKQYNTSSSPDIESEEARAISPTRLIKEAYLGTQGHVKQSNNGPVLDPVAFRRLLSAGATAPVEGVTKGGRSGSGSGELKNITFTREGPERAGVSNTRKTRDGPHNNKHRRSQSRGYKKDSGQNSSGNRNKKRKTLTAPVREPLYPGDFDSLLPSMTASRFSSDATSGGDWTAA